MEPDPSKPAAEEGKGAARRAFMKKMKLSSQGLVKTAFMDDDLVSPGLNNEALAKCVLSQLKMEPQLALGRGAYGQVWLCTSPDGESVVVKITLHEDRQDSAQQEFTILEELKGLSSVP